MNAALLMRATALTMTMVSCAAVPTYVLLLVTLVRKRREPPFHSSFYRICRRAGIVDILAALFVYWYSKLPRQGYLNDFFLQDEMRIGLLPWACNYVMFTATAVQFLWNTTLALNRFTSFYFPFTGSQMWTDENLRIASVLIVFIALSIGVNFWREDSQFAFMRFNVSGGFSFVASIPLEVHAYHWKQSLALMALCMSVCLLVSSVCYIGCFIAILNNRRRIRNTSVTRRPTVVGKKQVQLAFNGFYLFLLMTVVFVATALEAAKLLSRTAYFITWFVCGDLVNWGNVFIIMICSRNVRNAMLETLRMVTNGVSVKKTPWT